MEQAILVMNPEDYAQLLQLIEAGTQAHGDEFFEPILTIVENSLQEIA